MRKLAQPELLARAGSLVNRDQEEEEEEERKRRKRKRRRHGAQQSDALKRALAGIRKGERTC